MCIYLNDYIFSPQFLSSDIAVCTLSLFLCTFTFFFLIDHTSVFAHYRVFNSTFLFLLTF